MVPWNQKRTVFSNLISYADSINRYGLRFCFSLKLFGINNSFAEFLLHKRARQEFRYVQKWGFPWGGGTGQHMTQHNSTPFKIVSDWHNVPKKGKDKWDLCFKCLHHCTSYPWILIIFSSLGALYRYLFRIFLNVIHKNKASKEK